MFVIIQTTPLFQEQVDWDFSMGWFRLQGSRQAGSSQILCTKSGQMFYLPFGQELDAAALNAWSIEENWDYWKAKLVCRSSALSVTLHEYFEFIP
eukprot:5664615-Prorocentrum_lima.AAC.1